MNLLQRILISKEIVYHFKNKEFSVYQNLIELFRNLRDANINPKEVLKSLVNFQSDLGEIKKKEIKIRGSNKCNTKC